MAVCRTAAAAVRAVSLISIIASVSGTHFRYGTIKWFIDQDTLNRPSPLDTTVANTFTAVFEMKLAFRRDYSWGSFFNEQWRVSDTSAWQSNPNTVCGGAGIQCFESTTSRDDYEASYQIKFPNGQGTSGVDLVPVADPKICASPLHKGVEGDWMWDPKEDECDQFGGYMDPSLTPTGELRCSAEEYNPPYLPSTAPANPATPNTDEGEAAVCAPWHEVVGFYFGDNTYSFENELGTALDDGPVLNIEEVDFEGSLLGNVIVGTTDNFAHTYTVDPNTIEPGGYSESQLWVAFFTGGNRLSTLVNNADGRYRLEVGVKFEFVNASLIENRSPIAYMVPVLAVPYVATTPTRIGAHFQVAAFDQDYFNPLLRDEVRYFLGNSREHGGVMANYVYRLTDDGVFEGLQTWYQDYYYRLICEQGLAESATAGSNCASEQYFGSNPPSPYIMDTRYTAGRDYYGPWSNLKNLPQAPPNLEIDPKTGVVVWETGAGPGDGAVGGNFGSRTTGGGLEPGFYNVVIMIEERHNGVAADGYPDHLDDNGNDINNGTGFVDVECQDDYDGFGNGIKPVYNWEPAVKGGTGSLPAGYSTNSNGIATCRASPAAPMPPSVGPAYGTVKVPLDFLLYLYPTMHYCSQGCNMPSSFGGSSCGPWNEACQDGEFAADSNSVMQTFETDTGWYGDVGAREDGLSDTSVDGILEVTGACKICGGGGEYSRRAISNVGELVTVSYRPTNGSIYCEVPDVDPLAGQASLTQAQLDSALANAGAATGLRGNLVFDTLNYGGVNQDGVASGSTASFRLRDLYDTSSSTNFPPTSYPINPSGSVTAGQFPPSRTGATNIGALCTDQGWVTFSNFAGFTAQAQTEFMFQGCLGTSAGTGVDRFGAIAQNTLTSDNPFGGDAGQSILPLEGANCYINLPPRFVTFCSCDNVTDTTPDSAYGNTPAMGCNHVMQVKNTLTPYLSEPFRSHLATCCPASAQMTTTTSTNTGDFAKYPGMFTPAQVRGVFGSDVNFFLTARDDDQCTELVVGSLGLPDVSMSLGDYQRLDARTVSRKFTWSPRNTANEDVTVPGSDARDVQTLVCFYASDRYAITALPFHCVQITLENPTSIVWCDQDKDRVDYDILNRRELIGAKNTVYRAYAGEEMRLPLCVMKREKALNDMNDNLNVWQIHWEDIGGESGHPSTASNTVYNYPYDEINFPASGRLMIDDDRCEEAYTVAANDTTYMDPDGDRWYPSTGTDLVFQPSDGTFRGSCGDPLYMYYSFTPQEYEECVYTVCFQGYDELTAPEGTPIDPTLNNVEATEVRCFKIEVYNNVLQFDGTAGALDVDVSAAMLPQEGFTMTAWVYPTCAPAGSNMTAAYFGSVRDFDALPESYGKRDTGNELRNAINFQQLGDGLGKFFYYDIHVGPKITNSTFCCDKWHYVGVSIMPNNTAYMFVDGVDKVDQLQGSRDTVKYEVVPFETPSRPDHMQDIDTALSVGGTPVASSGYFALGYFPGSPWVGAIDEVRLWKAYMPLSDVKAWMYRHNVEYTASLVGHYNMGDGRAATHGDNGIAFGYRPTTVLGQDSVHTWTFRGAGALANYASSGRPQTLLRWPGLAGEPAIEHRAIPAQVPCVLGMQHAVGPVDGQCVTDVYAWNVADGVNPKCSFGGVEVPGTYVSDDVIRCETPGHFTPRFVVVKASNDGTRFTDTVAVDKAVNHLFLESSLYVDGGLGGAEANSVCQDIPKRSVSFGGWTCPKCGPPMPSVPPPPSPPPSPPPPSPPPPPPSPPPSGGK